jgi:hypothetical protein
MKKQNQEKVPDVERDDWEAKKIVKESSNEESDEVVRKILRGDESEGDPDERDIAPSPGFKNTPRGRKENNPAEKK